MNTFEIAAELWYMVQDERDGTLSSNGDTLPTRGYYVGGKNPSLVFDKIEEVDRSEVAWWIGSHGRSSFYGVWTDRSTGKVYFDAVTHFITYDAAMHIGRKRGEIAIWDVVNAEEIMVEV